MQSEPAPAPELPPQPQPQPQPEPEPEPEPEPLGRPEHAHEPEHEPEQVSEQVQASAPMSVAAPLRRLLGFRSRVSETPSLIQMPPRRRVRRHGMHNTIGCQHKQSVRAPANIERCGMTFVYLRSHDQPEPWHINRHIKQLVTVEQVMKTAQLAGERRTALRPIVRLHHQR